MLSEEQKLIIYNALKVRIGNFECPMCRKGSFTIVDSYSFDLLQDDYKNIKVGSGRALPSIPIVCTNCGFISHHALGVLGLLEEGKQ